MKPNKAPQLTPTPDHPDLGPVEPSRVASTVPPAPSSPGPKRLSQAWTYALAAAVVVVLLVVGVVYAVHYHKVTAGTTNTGQTANTSSPAPVPSGTDNQTLNADLSSIGGGLNKETQDQNAANSAVNDQQQEVSVPTN